MKKFKVEVDGEEFIVKIEEMENEESDKTEHKTSTGSRSSSVEQKSKTKTTTTKPGKDPQIEMETPAEIGDGDVVAPMPGSILEINVKKGDTVSEGDLLIILEAMKMENEIIADQSGTVKDIKVRVGDSVDTEDILMVIE